MFGHKKGAFTGALYNYSGLIKEADQGLLILEEVGDLPEFVQAQLLTFIETKEYRSVGDTKTHTADVQIVAATNKEQALREDFKYRFSLFYIPPLYKRRIDVLIYFAIKFPDLFRDLAPWEVLTLLAYNWPGNVRELERYGEFLLINREDVRIRRDKFPRLSDTDSLHDRMMRDIGAGLDVVKDFNVNINTLLADRLLEDLKRGGVNIECLEDYLNSGNIGLLIFSKKKPFNNLELSALYSKNTKIASDELRFLTISFDDIASVEALHKVDSGFQSFCRLFAMKPDADSNLLELNNAVPGKWHGIQIKGYYSDDYIKIREINKLDKAVRNYLLERLEKKRIEEAEIYSLKENEVLFHYYNELIDICNGSKRDAAKRAGLKYRTFISRYNKIKNKKPAA